MMGGVGLCGHLVTQFWHYKDLATHQDLFSTKCVILYFTWHDPDPKPSGLYCNSPIGTCRTLDSAPVATQVPPIP